MCQGHSAVKEENDHKTTQEDNVKVVLRVVREYHALLKMYSFFFILDNCEMDKSSNKNTIIALHNAKIWF